MTREVKVREVPFNNPHLDQKWLVLEAYVDGCEAVTKRRTINTYALASGKTTLEAEEAKLVGHVTEYLARWEAVEEARAKRRGPPDDKPKDPK